MKLYESTEQITAPAAYILNALASASASYARYIDRVSAELAEAKNAKFDVPTYGQPYTDLLTAGGKVNALIDAAQPIATDEQIAAARTGEFRFTETV